MNKIETNDAGKLISIIDNSNYQGEAKILYHTYYGYFANPFCAILSLLIKK